MIVSWNWLSQYVDLQMSHDELTHRLTMSGLNHEGTEEVFGDQAIDLEVTSNRPDCLGHIGVAREISVLFDLSLNIPEPAPETSSNRIGDSVSVEIQCPQLCYRYTARLIRGAKIGPSPDWLADRLRSLGIAVINNVVDASNYVMFECGQPLHAFDFAKVTAGKIIVREPKPDESIVAIDHKTYALQPGMCVIADAEVPVALGGVMGGADSEVSDTTTDVLVEAAYFNPGSIRDTARKLNLHSPSSFRFERDVDSAAVDWASRRCCELILESGGGELLDGMVDVGQRPPSREPIRLRLPQLRRILGTGIPPEFVNRTLRGLGMPPEQESNESVRVTPPSWRKDLTREVDLVEEVGRIYGYERVPENSPVPMAASRRVPADRVLDKVRTMLTAAGFDEAMTSSLVPELWSAAFSPWTDRSPLISGQPMLGVLEKASQNIGSVECLRRSLIPSLLEVRRINEYRTNLTAEIFETAKVYLPRSGSEIPEQPMMVALVSGRDFLFVKGVIQSLVGYLNADARIVVEACDFELLDITKSCRLLSGEQTLGWLGEISESAKQKFGLRHDATVAEIDFRVLQQLTILVPQHQNQSLFPPVSRDFNFIVNNGVHWSDLETTVRTAGGELLESIEYRETFRDEKRDGSEKKRLLLSVVLRSARETLTGGQVDKVCQQIVDDCGRQHDAVLVG